MIMISSYENKMCLGHEGKGEPCQGTSQALDGPGVVDGKGIRGFSNHSPKKASITPNFDVVLDRTL